MIGLDSVQTLTRLSVPSVGWSASLQPNEARQRRSPGSARYAQGVEKCGRTEKDELTEAGELVKRGRSKRGENHSESGPLSVVRDKCVQNLIRK